ncbi:MAG: glucose-6-phosphate isomerase family protein [bacterium]
MALKVKPTIRYLKDLKDVIYDQKWHKETRNFPVYYMYRGIKKRGGWRYDITIIPPNMLGEEYTKTQGHRHIGAYNEAYSVLSGKAIFFLQKIVKGKVFDAYVVEAKKGEGVVIPSNYGHITINPANYPLKLANWIKDKSRSSYEFIGKKRGGCYYYLESGWMKNKHYGQTPSLRFEKPIKKIPLSFFS